MLPNISRVFLRLFGGLENDRLPDSSGIPFPAPFIDQTDVNGQVGNSRQDVVSKGTPDNPVICLQP